MVRHWALFLASFRCYHDYMILVKAQLHVNLGSLETFCYTSGICTLSKLWWSFKSNVFDNRAFTRTPVKEAKKGSNFLPIWLLAL